jgi:hypothetical protein
LSCWGALSPILRHPAIASPVRGEKRNSLAPGHAGYD